jgi:hypothetical protein
MTWFYGVKSAPIHYFIAAATAFIVMSSILLASSLQHPFQRNVDNVSPFWQRYYSDYGITK